MKVRKAEDVGSRIEHYMELQEAWSNAYAILTHPNHYHSPQEGLLADKLRAALDLLENFMRAEYSNVYYAQVINALPKAEDIKVETDTKDIA